MSASAKPVLARVREYSRPAGYTRKNATQEKAGALPDYNIETSEKMFATCEGPGGEINRTTRDRNVLDGEHGVNVQSIHRPAEFLAG